MSKRLKICLFIVGNILLITMIVFGWYFFTTYKLKLDKNLLTPNTPKIIFTSIDGNTYKTEDNEEEKIEISSIPIHVKNAFIAVEDKRFYKHKGIDKKGLIRATFNNIRSFSFKEGGSTISQQLIKNTHLSSEKTIKRKVKEYKLVKILEKEYTKDQILEIYLNSIYFGEGCYGISQASKCYFNKSVNDLTVAESAVLAGIIKAPTTYSPFNNYQNCLNRRNVVLKLLKEQNYIGQDLYTKSVNEKINVNKENSDTLSYNYLAKKEISSIIDKMPYSANTFYVTTYFDKELNNVIDNSFNDYDLNCEKTMIITNKFGKILAYKSTIGNVKRQPGSLLKPLLVYLPAIESNKFDACTLIKDEKTNFNGYIPKNFNDKYNGMISVKDSLAISSNVCAVKILQEVGINKAKSYLNQTDLGLDNESENLSLALGATSNGITFTNLVGAYNLFTNNGFYYKPTCIKEIKNSNNKIIYKDLNNSKKTFSPASTEIVREMLKKTAETGTAKKLSNCPFPLYAKTGTVGNSYGNTDAYTLSFNRENIVGVWLGNKENEKLSNNITGGGLPCNISVNLWKNVYKNKQAPGDFEINNAFKIAIDKEEYKNNKIVIADILSPENEKNEELFTLNRIPKAYSTRYSSPITEKPIQSVINNGICIRLCLSNYLQAIIYRNDGSYKKIVCNTKDLSNKNLFLDTTVTSNKIYQYSIIPYYETNDKTYYGKEIFLDKIKSPIYYIGDDEWID